MDSVSEPAQKRKKARRDKTSEKRKKKHSLTKIARPAFDNSQVSLPYNGDAWEKSAKSTKKTKKRKEPRCDDDKVEGAAPVFDTSMSSGPVTVESAKKKKKKRKAPDTVPDLLDIDQSQSNDVEPVKARKRHRSDKNASAVPTAMAEGESAIVHLPSLPALPVLPRKNIPSSYTSQRQKRSAAAITGVHEALPTLSASLSFAHSPNMQPSSSAAPSAVPAVSQFSNMLGSINSHPSPRTAKQTGKDHSHQASSGLATLSTQNLLLDWRISVKAAKEKAKELGFTLKEGPFSSEEDRIILNCVKRVCANKGISEAIFQSYLISDKSGGYRKKLDSAAALEDFRILIVELIPNRLAKSVQLHTRKMLDPTRRLGPFTVQENERILSLYAQFGADWKKIGGIMARAGDDIKHQYRKHLSAEFATGGWTAEEIKKFDKAFAEEKSQLKEGKSISWVNIAHQVGTRSAQQCRNHWCQSKTVDHANWDVDTSVAFLEAIRTSNAQKEKDIRFKRLREDPSLCSFSKEFLQRQWKILLQDFEVAHGDRVYSFPDMLEKMIKDAHVPQSKRQVKTKFASAEYVSTSDEDSD